MKAILASGAAVVTAATAVLVSVPEQARGGPFLDEVTAGITAGSSGAGARSAHGYTYGSSGYYYGPGHYAGSAPAFYPGSHDDTGLPRAYHRRTRYDFR